MTRLTDSATSLGMEVEIGRIERALHDLWQADDTSTKASLINLAAYSESPDALDTNTRMVAEIARTHACRAIVVGARPDAPESRARAWITAHCNLIGAGKSVCSEQITFELSGGAVSGMRNIVFAHLASDLPLVFWWQGPLSEVFEPRLYNLVDRLIVNSADWTDDLPGALQALDSAVSEAPDSMVVHDLSWSRCYQLRLAFALFFDSRRARRELDDPVSLDIAFRPACRPTALLLPAWISHGLGWRLVDGDRSGCRIETPTGRAVQVTLTETSEAQPPVSRVCLETRNAAFEITLAEPARFYHATAEIDGVTHEQIHPADPATPAALVTSQLARAGNNRMLREILPAFRAFATACS